MATEMGIDISTVAGTGSEGRIAGDDVKAAAAGGGIIAATPTTRVLTKTTRLFRLDFLVRYYLARIVQSSASISV